MKVDPVLEEDGPLATQNHAQAKADLNYTWVPGPVPSLLQQWKGSDRYNILNVVARRQYVTVYKVSCKYDGTPYAAKEVNKRQFARNGIPDQKVYEEMKILRNAQHSNIVRHMKYIDWNSPTFIIIMEYISGGDLCQFVERHGCLTEAYVKAMARQTLGALDFLHQNLLVHRDIKPSSILIESDQPFTVKLAGFSLSKADNDEQYLQTFTEPLPYCAPESYPGFSRYDSHGKKMPRGWSHPGSQTFVGSKHECAVDIWGLGGTLYFALTRQPPVHVSRGMSESELLHRIMSSPLNTTPLLERNICQDCVHFLSSMLLRRPEARASIGHLQALPWLISSKSMDENHELGLQPDTHMARDGPENSFAAEAGEQDTSISDSGYGTTSNSTRRVSLKGDPAVFTHEGPVSSQVNTDADDNGTIYSNNSSMSDVRTEIYNSQLAKDLFARLDLSVVDMEVLDNLTRTLPELLKALAFKLGHNAPSQMYRDIMVFLYKHRHSITKLFRESYLCTQASGKSAVQVRPKEPPATDVMDRWLNAPDMPEYEDITVDVAEEQVDDSDDGFDDDAQIPGLEEYRKLVSSDPGYDWLLTLTFTVDWDPVAFLAAQEYGGPIHEAVAKAITLTGDLRDAQALSCQEYLAQTWPSSGPLLMQLIENLIRNRDTGAEFDCQTPNGTQLSASIVQSVLLLKASGIPDFVAEIGEQLAWLGAALQPSTSDLSLGMQRCIPFVDKIHCITLDNEHDYLECSIKFWLREPEVASQREQGQCWHALFRRPVLVEGFPILRRSKRGAGLEMSLEMMAALTGARSVDIFNFKVYIKGFSAMLVPTKRFDDTIVWHLLHNTSPDDRISYLDCPISHEDIQLASLGSARHIVGWCSEVDCSIGNRQANPFVRKSGLPRTHSGCALEKVEIQGGQFILGTASFSIGNREKPVHISRAGYMNKMQWISSKYVIFWDEAEKRGWLVNGARALLHLLRASLEHSKKKFKSAFLLEPQALGNITLAAGADSALDALIDPKNRTLTLYIDKSEVYEEETRTKIAGTSTVHVVTRRQTRYYQLEDRVEHIYNMLEKLIDHQADIERQSGLQLNARPRRYLEGWDFSDLVTDGDPFFPKVSTLQTIGKGWVDFTRAIHAVCLFGQGFGEMIRPRQTMVPACPRWNRLPIDRYYLAACVQDIKEIIKNDGDDTINPTRLCDTILWHMKQTTFQACPCTKDVTAKHYDPVQVLFPKAFSSILKLKPPVSLEDRGAVIFGHNMNLHWHWRDHGSPVKGDPPLDTPAAVPTGNSGSLGLSSNTGALGSRSNSSLSLRSDTPPSSQLSPPFSSSNELHSPTGDTPATLNNTSRAGGKRFFSELGAPISSIGKRFKSIK
ncbi:hypothetical protein JX265_005415 [Neoarthrinium moseri]|uniref:Autophagy-related protein 1 n=1 Tax=Neoarthrinium moseri TaxID=1658444 RepID=A0A9P9WNJ1_9PEZI|nr:hypothetical protein JX265_005415 [Neoarthrinium moseri]